MKTKSKVSVELWINEDGQVESMLHVDCGLDFYESKRSLEKLRDHLVDQIERGPTSCPASPDYKK